MSFKGLQETFGLTQSFDGLTQAGAHFGFYNFLWAFYHTAILNDLSF